MHSLGYKHLSDLWKHMNCPFFFLPPWPYYFCFHTRYKWTAKVSKPLSSHRIDEECELDAPQTKAQGPKKGSFICPVGSVYVGGHLREEDGIDQDLMVSFKERVGRDSQSRYRALAHKEHSHWLKSFPLSLDARGRGPFYLCILKENWAVLKTSELVTFLLLW